MTPRALCPRANQARHALPAQSGCCAGACQRACTHAPREHAFARTRLAVHLRACYAQNRCRFSLGEDKKIDAITRTTKFPSSEVALGIRKASSKPTVSPSALVQYARECLSTTANNEDCIMSTSGASMLPPSAMHHPHLNGNRLKGDYGGDQQATNGGATSTSDCSGTPPNANLTEESMMALSQSIDSIHTMGTTGGSDGLDVSCCFLLFSWFQGFMF